MSTSSTSAARSRFEEWLPSKEDKPGLLVVPGVVTYGIFMLYPLMYLVFLSFTNAGGAEDLIRSDWQFVGLENYLALLTDGQFWNSMGVTWLFVFVSVVLKVIAGIGISLLLTHERVRGKRFMRALVIVPLGLPPVFVITIWRNIFSPARFGVANELYIRTSEWINGLPGPLSSIAPASPEPIAWFSDAWFAFASYVITELWLAYPFMVIIIVSALQDVPAELHDAAKVDGASYLNRFVHVTLPAIKRPVWFAAILTAATSFQQFLIPFIFNDGGPGRRNEFILLYGYREAISLNPPNMSLGAAIMVIALMFIGMFMWLNVKKGRLADGVSDA